jgi:hypothetical protein
VSKGQAVAVICAPTKGNPEEAQIEGSVQRACRQCGAPVWVAPSGQRMLERLGELGHIYCVPCGVAALEADPDPTTFPITLDQALEMAEHRLRRD